MAASKEDSYCKLLEEWHKRDDYEATFRSVVEDLASKVDFSWIKSCVAFGTGGGVDEIAFMRRLMPNLRLFVAIEPDSESVAALQQNFEDGQLSWVEARIAETKLESWSELDTRVDAALLFNVLFHVKLEDRRALFEKLSTRYLNQDGIVAIIENESADASGFMRLMKRLGNPEYRYKDVERDMLDAGFSVVLTQSITGKRDLRNPGEDVLTYIELLLKSNHCTASHEEIRLAIADIFSQPEWQTYNKRLAIFRK